ncbi:MAG TPA: septum formation initiator family protein, partial [Kribbella sp.]|nr:septum formation initiator family protein [Kribbella sp.]
GWVMPGEVGYRVIGADGKPLGAPPEPSTPSDGAADTQKPTWYTKLWGSVQGAGTPPAPAAKPTPTPTPAELITPSPKVTR